MEEKFWQEEEAEAAKSSPFLTRNASSNIAISQFSVSELAALKDKSTFGSSEKLKSRKLIDQLFNEGKSVSQNGFTLVYLFVPLATQYPAQAAFSVPKRNYKHATDRNRIKRLMREVWRKNKRPLYEQLTQQQKQLAIMWVCKSKEFPDYSIAEKTILHLLEKLKSKIA